MPSHASTRTDVAREGERVTAHVDAAGAQLRFCDPADQVAHAVDGLLRHLGISGAAPSTRTLGATDGDQVTCHFETGEPDQRATIRLTGAADDVANATAGLLALLGSEPSVDS